MGRCANENGLAKAFSQLEITSYWDLITTTLGLHHSSDVTFGSQGHKLPNLKLAKLQNMSVLAEIAKLNAHQIFPLYGIPFKFTYSKQTSAQLSH